MAKGNLGSSPFTVIRVLLVYLQVLRALNHHDCLFSLRRSTFVDRACGLRHHFDRLPLLWGRLPQGGLLIPHTLEFRLVFFVPFPEDVQEVNRRPCPDESIFAVRPVPISRHQVFKVVDLQLQGQAEDVRGDPDGTYRAELRFPDNLLRRR